ncbi:hypothetical protein AU468_13000 [Alkalispirochaeta sphaeroplastigenens]|uniref:Uncharacterized protein n=1 Tax=Alkalispirochaeta sphaeroplastigenens TaxID=1187066 RepID=A0A2S4JG20_9SPIO|nr:hypothetical protein [Alkalispirochaeta sphaeroplastigenens]POQ98504.1 hypothetical protein AU468_13000 [Alkalispirochaeta sphaeroplastigenens]
MTIYRLTPQPLPSGGLVLRLGWGWRVFFALLTAIFLGVVLYDGQVLSIAGVLSLVSLLAALYQEFWCFDLSSDEIISREGLLFVGRTRRYRLSRAERLLLRLRAPFDPDAAAPSGGMLRSRRPVSAPFQRGYVQLFLELSPVSPEDAPEESSLRGESLLVQTESLRNRESLQELGEEVSRALGIPLEHRFG